MRKPMPMTMLSKRKKGVKGRSKLRRVVFLSLLLAVLPLSQALAQGSITGTVENSDTSVPADSELVFWGFLDDTDEEIRTELSDGAGFQNGYWWDDFQNYLTEAPGNPYDYYFSNLVNSEAYHLAGLIPNNSYQEENITLASASNPSKPTGVKTTVTSTSRVVVSWNKVAGVTYHVYRRYTSSNGSLFRLDNTSGSLSDPGVSDSFFVDTTVDGISSFTYMVIGEDASGNYTPHSDEATANSSTPTAPVVTSISPNTGPTAGGTFVTIYGENFDESGVTVTIGGVSATSVTAVSPFEITCLTPAGSPGAADVVVTNTASSLASSPLSGGFTYYVNTPPVADAGSDQLGIIPGTLVTLDGSSSYDTDGDSLGYHWSQTSGPYVTLSDSNIVNPTFAPDTGGTYYFQLYVDDAIDYSQPDTVMITVQNQAPVLDSIGPKVVNEGETLEFRIHATDPDGDSIILSAADAPLNSSFTDSGNGAGSFTFTPDYTQSGTYYVTFEASDGSLVDKEVVEITVNHVNLPPELDAIGSRVVVEGDTLEFRIYASDPDLDAITLDTADVPMNATFVDSGNGAGSFAFTPDFTQSGVYNVTFTASDGALADTEVVEITVTEVGNQAPVVSDIPGQTISEGQTFATISLDDYVTDADDADSEMVWTYSGNTELIVDITDRVATISTPNVDWNGSESITFRATDPGSAYDEDAATFTVTAVNDTPVVADIPNQTILEGQSFATINLDDYVSDVDDADSEMVWTYSGNVELIVDITDRVATISTPNVDWNGSESITFRATDPGSLYDEDAATFTVTAVNDTPVVADIPDQTISEGQSFASINLDDYVADADDADSEMVWTYSGNVELIVDITDRVATISTPNVDWNGSESITFRATDLGSLYDEDAATFTVTAVNDTPVVADIPNQTIAEGESFTTVSLDDYVSDVDDPDSDMVWTYTGNVDLSVDITDRVATITTPNPDWNGSETITFRATDLGSLYDEDAATFTVTAVNDTPVVADIPDQNIAEGESFTTISLDDYVSDVDDPDSDMVWTYTGNVELIVDITDRVATISTPDVDWNGSEIITFRATDPGTLYDEDAATFTVSAVGDTPVVSDIPNQTIPEGSTFATINLDDYVSDVDDPDSEMVWTYSGNVDLSVDITDRVATITTPNPDWNGAEAITFRATDPGTLYDEDAATFTVNAVNDTPVVADIPNQTIAEGESFAVINLDDYVSDVDDPDSHMVWTHTGNVELMVDITDRVATISTPDVDWNGSESITFRATDPGTLYDEDAATFTVSAVGDTPVVSDIPNQTIPEGSTFATINLDDYVTDVDNPDSEMVWTYSGNVELSVDITDRVATITTPDVDWNGSEIITFRATDTDSLYDEDAATFTVNAVNDTPVVADIPDQNIAEGLSFAVINLDDYVSDVDDPDSDLVWTYTGNLELSVDITDRIATITTPGLDWNGSEIITFRATDPGALYDEDAATFTVTAVNDTPVVADIPNQTITEGESFAVINLDDYVSDVDDADSEMVWSYTGNVELIVDITDRVATITTLGVDWNGSEIITFRATDPGSLYDEDAAAFTVTAVNDTPVVADIPNQTIAEGESFTTINLDDYVSDADNPDSEMVWTYSGNVELSVDITDRIATITTPNPDWNGSETITFRATDPDSLYDEDAATFTVTAVNDTPVVADIPNQTIVEGESFTSINLEDYVSDVDDPDSDMVWTYSGNIQLTVDITDRVATITTPTPDWNGSETITFRATDPGTLYDEDAATFTVTAVSDTPVVSDIPNQTISEGESFAVINLDDYVSDVDDPDSDMVWTYSGNVDLSVDITDRVATITTPDVEWNGSESITFRAMDPDSLYDEDAATFTVTAVNDTPVVADIPNQTIAEGESFATISLDDYVSDVDDPDSDMVWTYTGNVELNVDITNRVATITTPTSDWNGSEAVTFRATDPGTLYDEDAATFTATAVSDTPVVSDIPNQTISEGETFASINLDDYVTDVDDPDSEMVWTYSGNVELSIDITDRVATITTPDVDWNGSETITFRATDPDSLYDEDAATFTVTAVNDTPVVADIPDQNIAEGESFATISLDDYVSDVDDPDSDMVWTYSGNVQLIVDITDRVATITTPTPDWNGSETITFRATDPGGAYSEDAATFTVTGVNDAPVLDSIGSQSVVEGGTLQFRVHATDIDGDSLILSALDVPVNGSFVDSGNGAGSFLFTPDFTQAGVYPVTFIVSDGSLADSELVQITVTEFGNNAPELDPIGPQAVDEGDTLELRIRAIDLDGDSIILSALDVPANASFFDSGNGASSFIFTPDFTQSSIYTVTFIASDGSLSDSELVEVTVNHVNIAPVLDSIRSRTVIEGGYLSFLVTASDFDGDSLILSAQNMPNHASFTDSGNGTGRFEFNPDYTQSGFYYVTFKVSDTALSDSEIVEIRVIDAGNQPPVLDSIGPRSVAEVETLKFRVHAIDPDGGTPALFVRNNPANSSFVDSGNGSGSLTFAPTYDQAGDYYVTFAATDGVLLDSEVVVITVENVNRPPVLDSIGSQMVEEGGTLQFRIHASDPDLDSLILDTLNVPENAVFVDSGNGAGSFVFTPSFTQAGIYYVTFIVNDTLGGSDSEVVEITVNEFGNNVPELDSIGPQAVNEGETLELRIRAVDVDGDSIILDTLNVPLNATFVDSGNGAGSFIFAPDFTQSGVYDVTFIASDGSLADSELVQITVNHVNLPPALDSIGPKVVIEGDTLEFRVHASDPDLDSLILSALDVPTENASFVDSSNGAGSFLFTPDFTQSGTYFVTFISSDGSLADSEVVQITVSEFGNNPPVLDSIGSQTVVEGDTLEFRVYATDIDADSIFLSALGIPTNAGFVDSGNGAGSFVFTPDFTQSGTYPVTFIASDGALADTEIVDITVTEFGNHAPVLDSIGPQSVIEGDTLELVIHATDIDADSVILDTVNVPTNAVFVDSGNGAGSFVFMPDFTQSGIYNVTFIAFDGSLADSEVVEITVTEFGNHAPELDSIGPQSVVEGDTLKFRIHATDIDADSIILSALDVPTNATLVDSGNGAGSFLFVPEYNQAGVYPVTFISSDGSLADSEVVQITVTEFGNIAPVLDSIGPQSVVEGQTLELRLHATDIDGDSIILDTVNVPTNAVFVDSGNGAGSFTFMPDFTQSGTYNVTFIAFDGSLADSEVVEITVTEFGNHAPELDSIGAQAVVEGDTLEFWIHATDVDADSIILDTLDVPVNAVFVDSGNGAGSFFFTPDFTQAGTYSVTFIASDGSLADSEVVEITVTEFGNNPPELDSIGPQTVVEGSTLQFGLHASDPDLDSIFLRAFDVPANAVFVDSGNGVGSFTFNPDYTQAGTYYVTFSVVDTLGAMDDEVVEITVTEFGNNPPELDSIGPQTVVEGDTLEFRIHAIDPDADPLVLDTLNVPVNATFVDSGNGAGSFLFTPDFTQSGIYYVTFIASDGSLADSEAVEITVTEFGNHPPELDSIGSRSVMEVDTLKFRIHATDIDADSIILDTLNVPLNSVFVDSGNGAGSFTFVPDTGQAGTYYVTFIASDTLLAADSEMVEITVTEWSNRPPVLDSIGAKTVSEGDSLVFVVAASDPDGSIPVLSVSNPPDNAAFVDSGNGHGLFTFYPDFYQAGAETVTFNAIDVSTTPQLSDFENVVITIVNVNQPPQIDSIGPKTVQAGDTLEIRVVGTDPTDPDGGPLHLIAVGLPQNATFVDSGGGIGGFVFMPDYSQVGLDTVTFYCTDEGNPALSGHEAVEITVTEGANRPPVLDPIGYKLVNEGDTLEFRIHASDPDGTTPQLYTNQPLPGNAAFVDSGNGAGSFLFTPDYTQSGIHEVTFYATDGDLTDYEQVLIQVIEAGNQAPVLDSIGPQSVVEGDSLILTISATDPEGDSLVLSVDSLPTGASFADSGDGTGLFEFYPAYVQAGIYNVTFRASDGESADSEVVEITVIEAGNQPPAFLDSIGPKTVTELKYLQFLVSASDPDSTTPAMRASDLPPSATFTDQGDGTGFFSYQPTHEEQGVYYTLFEAIDSADTLLRDWELVEITVRDSNRAPDVDVYPVSPSYEINEGDTLRLTVVGTDPDGSVPSVHMTPLPENAAFVDSGNGVGVFTFVPGYDQGSSSGTQYLVTAFAVDEFYPDTDWAVARGIRVYDAPEPPNILPIGDTTIVEGTTLDIHVVTTSTVDIPALQASGLPTNSSFVDSGNGRGWFHFASDFTQGGFAYDVRFISTSRGLADTEYVHIAVLEYGNHAPTLDSIGPQTVGEEQVLSLRIHAWDIDGDSIILDALNLPPNAALADSGNGAGSFVFHPDWTQSGVYSVTFYARDTHAALDSEVVEITVVDIDQPPVLDPIGAKTVAEGETLQFRVHATDVDSDSLVLTASPLPTHASFVDSGNGAGSFTFGPDYYQSGGYSVFFVVSDLNSSDVEMVPITVTNEPQPPQIDPVLPQTVVEGDTLEFRIHATDPDGDAFTFSVENNPPNSSLTDSGNGAGSFWFAPSYVQAGGYLVTFKATDTTGRADSQIVEIDVTEAGNQPPVLSALPDTVVPVAEDTFTLHVYATDPDEDNVSLSAYGLPWNSEFADSGNGGGAFVFVPDTTQDDSIYLVTFVASDAALTDSQDVVVHVIWYTPGDANGDGEVTAPDVIYLLNYLFRDGTPPDPLIAGDCNGDGLVTPEDVVYLLNYLFRQGPPPGGNP